MNDKVFLAVNGTLMRGLELENNLKEVGASFIKESQTEKAYRLYSINDCYPAMVKDDNGASIDVEVYELSKEAMEIVLSKEPEGLTIEKITHRCSSSPSPLLRMNRVPSSFSPMAHAGT